MNNLKKKDPLIKVFEKYDVNGDGKISQEEALMFMAKYNSDGKAELSRKEFGQLEKEAGDMGRGERKLLNNDFLETIFGEEDVQITTDGNKKTFKTQDGKVLGTVEQDGDNYTFLNEAGKKTKTLSFSGSNLTTKLYDEDGENITKEVKTIKGAKGEEVTEYENGTKKSVTRSEDLIAQNKGIVKEDYSEKDGLQFRVLTDINGKQTTEFSMNGKMWLSEDVLKAMQAPVEEKEQPKEPVEEPKPKLGESLEKFGNKVTIDEDGSTQRLTKDKQWETSVRIPKGAETNENGAPTKIQIGLPSSYGKNAFQTLKLVDPENNIYEDRSGNRKFQVNITDDGVTLKHIDIDNDKIKAFLEANKRLEEEKQRTNTDDEVKDVQVDKQELERAVVTRQMDAVRNARTAFQEQVNSDGWAGKTADAVSWLWNSKNRASKVEEDLKAYEQQVKDLQEAQTKGSKAFEEKFKEIYGVDYNAANIEAYEANPTDENYKKAYGTKSNINKRVMDYNKSQQDGAAVVKGTVVAAASTAAAVATGGASIAVTAAVAGASTAASRIAVEVTDLATNNIDGDVNLENVNNIAGQAAVEGTISALTAGTMKGVANYVGKTGSKFAPKTTSTTTSEAAVVRQESQAASSSIVKSNAGNTTARNTTTTGAKNASTKAASNTKASSAAETAASTSNTASAEAKAFANEMASKVSAKGGLQNLTVAEKSKLSEMIGKPVDEIANMSKSELRKLQLKFHPDKNPGNEEFCQYIFSIIGNIA